MWLLLRLKVGRRWVITLSCLVIHLTICSIGERPTYPRRCDAASYIKNFSRFEGLKRANIGPRYHASCFLGSLIAYVLIIQRGAIIAIHIRYLIGRTRVIKWRRPIHPRKEGPVFTRYITCLITWPRIRERQAIRLREDCALLPIRKSKDIVRVSKIFVLILRAGMRARFN